jgi:hypothetical protein
MASIHTYKWIILGLTGYVARRIKLSLVHKLNVLVSIVESKSIFVTRMTPTAFLFPDELIEKLTKDGIANVTTAH